MHADRDRSEPPDIIVPSGHCWKPRQHEPHLFGDPPKTRRCDGSPVVIDTEHDVRAELTEPAAPDADRVNAYAEAYYRVRDDDRFGEPDGDSVADAMIVLADREQATLLAKIALLTTEVERLRMTIAGLDAEARREFDLGTDWCRRAEAAERALADERASSAAKVSALIAKVDEMAGLLAAAEPETSETGGAS